MHRTGAIFSSHHTRQSICVLTVQECLQPTVLNACVSRPSDLIYIHVVMIILIFTSHHNNHNHILMRNMTSNEKVFWEMNYETHIGSGYRCDEKTIKYDQDVI